MGDFILTLTSEEIKNCHVVTKIAQMMLNNMQQYVVSASPRCFMTKVILENEATKGN